MANDKNIEMTGESAPDQDFSTDSSTRARNRTVMLTPEITGQVRAMLAQELGGHEGQPAPAVTAPPRAKGGGYMSSPELSGTYQPSAPASQQSHQSQKGAAMAGGFGHVAEATRAPAAPARASQPAQMQQPVRMTPVVGFLVSFDQDANGEVYELRTGRWIVSSEQTTAGNFILVNSPSISTLHAIIRVSPAGEIQVLDQLSEFGTGVKKFGNESEDELTGAMASLEHGDVVRFGDRTFNVCVIQKTA